MASRTPDTATNATDAAPTHSPAAGPQPYVPIYHLAHHYYLYHAPTIAHLRSTYSLPGSLIGTLPQSAQQNVFLGLPLLLMPEEVSFLVKKGVAYIVDDVAAHRKGISGLEGKDGRQRRGEWMRTIVEAGAGVARGLEKQKGKERERALKALGDKEMGKRAKRRAAEEAAAIRLSTDETEGTSNAAGVCEGSFAAHDDDAGLFAQSEEVPTSPASSIANSISKSPQTSLPKIPAYSITPTTSHPPLALPFSADSDTPKSLPLSTPSSPLHAHLTKLSYVLTPGLRFGCQYLAYPGDPLRFHSHFLVVGRGWKEDVELSTLVGLGRLGTGVKKGVCFGGVEGRAKERKSEDGVDAEEQRKDEGVNAEVEEEEAGEDVRCFTIEWGGM